MKKMIILVILAVATVSTFAQKFGVKAGVNLSSYYGDDAKGSKTLTGFQVGGLYEMPLSEGFFLQPELLLTLKGAKSAVGDLKMKPFYLQVPVKAMYKLDLGTGKFTLAAGPYAAIGIAGKVSSGSESANLFTKEDGATEAMLKRFDLGLSSGIGYEFNSGLFINFESSLGFLNVAKDSKMKNSTLSLVAGFKF